MELKLSYISDQLVKFFEYPIQVENFDQAQSQIDNYVEQNQPRVDNLLEHWSDKGYQEEMYFDIDTDSSSVGYDRELYFQLCDHYQVPLT